MLKTGFETHTSLSKLKSAALAFFSTLTCSESSFCTSELKYGFRSMCSYWRPAMCLNTTSKARGKIPGSFGEPWNRWFHMQWLQSPSRCIKEWLIIRVKFTLYGVRFPSIGHSITEHQCVFALKEVVHLWTDCAFKKLCLGTLWPKDLHWFTKKMPLTSTEALH